MHSIKRLFSKISYLLFFLLLFLTITTKIQAACQDGAICLGSQGGIGTTVLVCRYKTTTELSGYCQVDGTESIGAGSCNCTNADCSCILQPGGAGCSEPSIPKTQMEYECVGGEYNGDPDCLSDAYCQGAGIYYDPTAYCQVTSSSGVPICTVVGSVEVSCCGPAEETPTATPTTTTTPTTTVAPRNLTVSGNLYLSSNPTIVGDQCTATGPASYTSRVDVSLYHNGSTYSTTTTSGAYSILVPNVTAGQTFTISAHTTDANYECSCPNDGEVTCSYYDLTVPALGTDTVSRNIYFDNIEQPESWFQSFGAGVFAQGQFTSLVPTNTCFSPTCQAAIFVPQSNNASVLSSGFPMTANTESSSILTGDLSDPFANIHLAGQRSSSFNQDSFATGFAGQALGYDYFYQLAVDSGSKGTQNLVLKILGSFYEFRYCESA